MSHNRRFIPPGQDTGEFLKTLQAKGLRHAVLRWFDTLPHVAPGEDIDILVADDDAPRLLAMLEEEGPGQPVDIYSVTGKHGLGWRGAPYLPPHKATELLANRIHGEVCDHPSPRDHLASLAFHVAFHKGSLDSADHDYKAALAISQDITLDDLAKRLKQEGWQPGLKALWRWRRHNPFICAQFVLWIPTRWIGA